MDAVDPFTFDTTTLTVPTFGEPSGGKAYWLSRTPRERLQAAEIHRRLNYGRDPSSARLQRVLEAARFETR